MELEFEEEVRLARIQALLIAKLLEAQIRASPDLSESEALQTMLEQVLSKLSEDSEANIHLALRIIYNLFL